MKVVFSGGGTGGHIYPALAIKETLERAYPDAEFAYIGVSGGMEDKIVSREKNIKFMGVKAQGMPRSLSLKWFTFPFSNMSGIFNAKKYLSSFKPDLVVTTGGFVAFPVLAAARLLGIPVVMHEQNAAMGVTNKLFADSAKKLLLTYASAGKPDNKRVIVTGNPVRASFYDDLADNQSSMFPKGEYKFTVAAVGGSRGALSLNRACVELSQKWLPEHKDIRLIHITGERDYNLVKKEAGNHPDNYVPVEYCHDMKEVFKASDLFISRAGATTLTELAVCGKPAILVPFPYATDNHQEKNARVLEEKKAAKVLLDKDMNYETLTSLLDELLDRSKLESMAKAMKDSRPANVEQTILSAIQEVLNIPQKDNK